MAEDNDFFDELESEAESAPVAEPKSLDAVRAMGEKAADLERRIENGDRLLKKLKAERYELLNKEMPSVMDELRVPFVGVDGYKLECVSYYKASIAADDPEETREAAFQWLDDAGGGDIVNNVVTVAFPKEDAEYAAQFAEEVASRFHNQQGVIVKRQRAVPWNRLTSWLKEYVETPPKRGEKKLPVPLELLNATIGRVVKIKAIKED